MQDLIIKELLVKQREYFNSGKTRSIEFRTAQLKKVQSILVKNEAEIFEVLNMDLGKSPMESYISEVGFLQAEIRYMLKNIKRLNRATRVRTPLIYTGARSYIYNDPLGVVLIIGPWNYPLQLIIAPLLGAIAAGNCAVLKPSELAPCTSGIIKKIIESEFDQGFIAVVEGDVEVSRALLKEKFDHIFFTGGTEVGRIVMQAAARNLTPVTLELGGKSPCIVDRNINIDYAARRICWGKFLNAGQTCVAPDYLLVHRDIKQKLLEKMKKVLLEFYGNDPQLSTDFARIINDRHFNRLLKLLGKGDIITGGDVDQAERYIAPTIIDNVSPDDPVMQEEIFGPILPVMEYKKLDEVIHFINERPKPLALYFFSQDKSQQKRIMQETTSGGVCINDCLIHITTRELPFGGVGESGIGSYHGKATFTTFSHQKSVMINSMLFDMPVKYPNYKISLQKMKQMLKLLSAFFYLSCFILIFIGSL